MELEKNKELPEKNNKTRFLKKYLHLSVFICGLNPFHSIKQQFDSVLIVNSG
ncbi:Uncharacterised protein [uncultured archaeon]|nr:Uncharacterised protein [uncultured archaeon]